MVLHDNKWDRRAKNRYIKKHGLAKETEIEPKEKIEIAPPKQVFETLPDFESNPELDALLAASRISRPNEESSQQEETRESVEEIEKRKTLFEEANAKVERSKLNQAIKTRIGRSNKLKSKESYVKTIGGTQPSESTEHTPNPHTFVAGTNSPDSEENFDDFLNAVTNQSKSKSKSKSTETKETAIAEETYKPTSVIEESQNFLDALI
ncbi:hypothetical protein DASB73_031610 [Starmerella bacillaris]|uniref:Uncharacterized protein n=1 Tax=Starmerella bacillaris TaxID=1247836 RepID=A0AAV5RN57_STABA|nr:hypothetical protein DASB73_031610 [Starmerella bacillaris]